MIIIPYILIDRTTLKIIILSLAIYKQLLVKIPNDLLGIWYVKYYVHNFIQNMF